MHLTDEHFPYHDRASLRNALDAISIVEPHYIIFGGDMIDAPGIAPFVRDPNTLCSLQEDIDQANAYIDDCRARAPKRCIFIFLPGNHEVRIQKYIYRQAPGLESLRALQINKLFNLHERNIVEVRPGGTYPVGSLRFFHGSLARKWGGRSSLAQSEREGCNAVVGHSHRFGQTTYRRGRSLIRTMDTGCLCTLDPHYMDHTPDWARGISVFYLWGARHQSFTWIPVWFDQPNPLAALEHLP